jgi:hypothetical protein
VRSEEPQPDHTDDPRNTVRSDQLPEEAPAEQTPDEGQAGEGSDASGEPASAG